jgi:hypothetical protein
MMFGGDVESGGQLLAEKLSKKLKRIHTKSKMSKDKFGERISLQSKVDIHPDKFIPRHLHTIGLT